MIARRHLLFAAALISIPLVAQSGELPNLGGRKVVVAAENAYPPLQFIDTKSGKPAGWEYDAMAGISKRLNVTAEFRSTTWDAMIPAVASRQFDIGMDGITIKDDRKEKVDFSVPYLRSEQFMLTRQDENRFADAKSFAADSSLRIGATPGSTPFYTAVYEILDGNETNPRIKPYVSLAAAVQALEAGEVDTVLAYGDAGRACIAASGGKLKMIGEPLGVEDFGFIFPKGSDLVGPVDAAIGAMKADGTLADLNRKWFGNCQSEP